MAKNAFAIEHKIVVLAIVGIIIIAGFSIWQQPQDNRNQLDVSGVSSITVDPDEVQVVLGAETQSATAAEAQQQNAGIISRVRANLNGKGITENEIETAQFTVEPVREYDQDKGTSRIVGYRAVHLLRIKSPAVDRAGEYIDAASVGGANRVDSVSFALSTAKEADVRKQALSAAASNARSKANDIAGGLGVRVTKIVRASEGFVSIPFPRSAFESAGAPSPTVISPGQLEVSASVAVTFEIG